MSKQWMSLVGALWLQSMAGTNTNFPAYSSQIKKLLSISQIQLNNLAFASDAGKLLGWFAGIAANYLPLWVVLLIGATLGLIGYGVQYLFLINYIHSLSYWHVFSLTFLAGNSICWINTVSYIVSIRNFPLDRQVAVGLSTSYISLSAKIVTDIVDVINVFAPSDERAKTYLLLNSVLPLLIAVVASPIIRETKVEKSRKLSDGFRVMFVITIATGIYAVITSIKPAISKLLPRLLSLIGMVIFLMLPILVPLSERIKEHWHGKCWIRRDQKICDLSNLEEEIRTTEKENNNCIIVNSGVIKEDNNDLGCSVMEEIGAKKMLMKLEFWLYFFVYLFGGTLGLVYLNNLGQIADTRGCNGTSSLVSLSSSFGFFGRLLPSLFDYLFSRSKYAVSRPATIAMTLAPMTGAFFLLLNNSHIALYTSTAIIGICTGAITSISVSQTTELFGAKNFGVNHNIVVANIPIGSFLFGDLAAMLYRRQGNSSTIIGLCSADLSSDYYEKSCPKATYTIKNVVANAVTKERRMGASLLRLHFHDCFGCDGSILLDDTSDFTGEKTAKPNTNSLRGFDVIDKIKSQVEKLCPGIVSCADIVAVAARDSVVLLGGPSWTVQLGRRDSTTASLSAANSDIPSPILDLSDLITSFSNKGFTAKEMVALAGGHTIGKAQCTTFRERVYNETNIDSSLATSLKSNCPSTGGDDTLSSLDATTPVLFDNHFYKNLVNNKGVLHSDQQLFSGGSTDSQVKTYSTNPITFDADFANAMVKMGNLSPLTGTNGQIRTNCRKIN
ncbi:Peroxidase 52 [Capsicum annuum]|nr:Peroxidase 52 [Capsicum annuum]